VNLWPFVRDAGAGIIIADEALSANLGSAMRKLLADRGFAQNMGGRGQRFATSSFVWQNSANLTYDLYQKVLDGHLSQSVDPLSKCPDLLPPAYHRRNAMRSEVQ
jgi:hypothetical protein